MMHRRKISGRRRLAALSVSGLCFLMTVLLSRPAAAEGPGGNPDPTPILRIETGMHHATIRRIAVDAQCRLLVTGSTDKTVRLWSMPEGRLLRTQRLPIGPGNAGKIYGIAVSPDGLLVAAGVSAVDNAQNGDAVYVFDSSTGAAIRRIGGFESGVWHLAFSPDGKRLAAAMGSGIRVIEVASGRELMADRDFGGKDSYGLGYAADGSLFTVGFDGSLRRYGPELTRTARIATSGKQPYSVAVDPGSKRLVVGFADTIAVEIYDAIDLRRIRTADTADVKNGNLFSVAWSRDGNRIYAGGRATDKLGRLFVRHWTRDGARVGTDVAAADATITSLVACGDAIAFGAADPVFGLIRPDGSAVTLGRGRAADMRVGSGYSITVSADGKRARFGLESGGKSPVTIDLAGAVLEAAATAPAGLARPKTDGIAITGWQDSFGPRLGGRALQLSPTEFSRSLAVRPDNAGFVLGTKSYLRAYDAKGTLRWKIDSASVVWGVNLARGGELVLTADADGTLHWYRWSDGKELLALFVDRESKAWVAWTPQGYYSASPGGEELIGWHVNRGYEQPSDFFSAARFRDTYARPDIVERVLDTLDEAEAVRLANAARPGKTPPARAIAEQLPPVVTILSPAAGSIVSGEGTRIDYIVRSPSGLPVDAVEALVDGRPLARRAGSNGSAAIPRRRSSAALPKPRAWAASKEGCRAAAAVATCGCRQAKARSGCSHAPAH